MPKQVLSTKTHSRIAVISLLIIGGGLGALGLVANQQFSVTLNLASMLSPTGARFTVAGFRLKHWMVGLALIGFGFAVVLKESKSASIKELGILILGAGAVLFGDELVDWDF